MAAREARALPGRTMQAAPAGSRAAGVRPASRGPAAAEGWPKQPHEFARLALLPLGGVQARRDGAAGGDACERQADRVAEQVMRGTATGGLRGALLAAGAGRVHEALVPGGAGRPLAPGVRAFMEARLGHDFGRVRIHADAGAAQAARAIDARAYATGHDIVFAAGQFAPETVAGQGLLAHELTHVVQQSRGGGALPQRKGFWGAIGGFFNSFFHIAIDYGERAIRKYLKVLEDTQEIEGDPDSDDMARQIVRDDQHRALSVEIRRLLVAEMLDGATWGGDERAITKILRTATEAERGQIVAKLGRESIWKKFSGRNRRVVEAVTLTANDLQDAALMARLERQSEAELVDYRSNAPDPAVQLALDRVLSRKRHELGSYPEAERRGITQGGHFNAEAADNFANDLEAARLQQAKAPAVNQSTTTGAVTYSNKATAQVTELELPPGVAIEFETRIAKADRPGLERIARHMMTPLPGLPLNLPPNLTRNVAVREMGRVFRYTRFPHAGEAGATELVLIEEVGPLPPANDAPAADWDVRQPRPGAMPAGVTPVRGFEIRRDVDWTEPEWRLVTEALNGFPESVLKDLPHAIFRRRPCQDDDIKNGVCLPKAQRGPDDRQGEHTPGENGMPSSITLFNGAFDVTPSRYGVSTLLVAVLAHEVGHQVDHRPLDEAQAAFDTGLKRIEAERDAELAKPEPPSKGKGKGRGKADKVPAKSPHDLAWDRYTADRAALQAALDAARALSGVARTDGSKSKAQNETPADTNGDFLKAALADGLVLTQERVTAGSITGYASKNVIEQFADLFSIYLTDPTLLQAIRPNVHAYFTRRFPRQP